MNKKIRNIKWVVTQNEKQLESTVSVSGDEGKVKAIIEVDKSTFIIERGFIIKGESESIDLKLLVGIEAHIEGKKHIRKKLVGKVSRQDIDLILQCVSSLIQAETYVFDSRGFKTKKAYSKYWDSIEANGCRFYSDSRKAMRTEDKDWMDYVPDLFESKIIFNREKKYLMQQKNGHTFFSGHLDDTYHQMLVKFNVNDKSLIDNMLIEILQAPGQACFQNHENGEKITGMKLEELDKKTIISNLGGCNGCYHIVEMVIEMVSLSNGGVS